MYEVFNKVKHFFIKMYNRLKKYFKSFNFDLDLNPDYNRFEKNEKELESYYFSYIDNCNEKNKYYYNKKENKF